MTTVFDSIDKESNFEEKIQKSLQLANLHMKSGQPAIAEAIVSHLFTSLVNRAFSTGLPQTVVVSAMTDSVALSNLFLTNGNLFIPEDSEIQNAVQSYQTKLKNVKLRRMLETHYPCVGSRSN